MGDNPNLYSPGVKWGVSPGSYTHMTEFFGPVLAVLRADNLDHAIEMVNQTGYGLTSGIESLDDREHRALARQHSRRQSLHQSRHHRRRGATASRLAGWARAHSVPGIKAGGPNYVAQLMRFEDALASGDADRTVASPEVETLRKAVRELGDDAGGLPPSDRAHTLAAIDSYDRWYQREFGRVHDSVKLVGAGQSPPLPAGRQGAHSGAPERQRFLHLRRGCAPPRR